MRLSLNSRLFYFLVNFRERPPELIEVQSISYNEVRAFQAAEFYFHIGFFVGPSNQHSDIYGFGFQFLEESYYFSESIAGI